MPQHNPYEMNDKQYAFCQIYLSELPRNARKAYLAVYNAKKVESADSAAARLLRNVKVKAYLDEQEKKSAKKLEHKYAATKESVLKEEGYLAFSKISDLFDDQGNLIPLNDLPEPVERALAIYEVTETTRAGTTTQKYKIQFHDKGKALDRLEKCFGMQKGVKEGGVDDDLRSLLEEIDGKHRGMLPCEIDEE